jgi:hypothetical protein
VRRYGTVAPDLFDAIVNACVAPDKKCLRDIMMSDMHRASMARDLRTTSAQHRALDALMCTTQDVLGRAPRSDHRAGLLSNVRTD